METEANNESRLEKSLSEGYEFKMGKYISAGFDIFKKEPWLLMGFLVVNIVISMVASSITSVLSAVVSVPLSVGFFIFANKVSTGRNAQFGDFFGGFKSFISRTHYFLLCAYPSVSPTMRCYPSNSLLPISLTLTLS